MSSAGPISATSTTTIRLPATRSTVSPPRRMADSSRGPISISSWTASPVSLPRISVSLVPAARTAGSGSGTREPQTRACSAFRTTRCSDASSMRASVHGPWVFPCSISMPNRGTGPYRVWQPTTASPRRSGLKRAPSGRVSGPGGTTRSVAVRDRTVRLGTSVACRSASTIQRPPRARMRCPIYSMATSSRVRVSRC